MPVSVDLFASHPGIRRGHVGRSRGSFGSATFDQTRLKIALRIQGDDATRFSSPIVQCTHGCSPEWIAFGASGSLPAIGFIAVLLFGLYWNFPCLVLLYVVFTGFAGVIGCLSVLLILVRWL